MIVYIPFNSNDFNSVFTTLSISPCSFYNYRKYSFRRATTTYFNENEDFLIGLEKPLFHSREFDKDYGFPVLIAVELDKTEIDFLTTSEGIRYLTIDKTIYLFERFKLIFRSEKEQNETLAKSLKSIETKFVLLAKTNCEIVKNECFVSSVPIFEFPVENKNINGEVFLKERHLNRLFGAILGSSIAAVNQINKEWQEISNLLRFLNNSLSLFLNKIGENHDFEKKQVLDTIARINEVYGLIETLDEAIMLGSSNSFTSEEISTLKLSKIFGIEAFNLLVEGLLSVPKLDLPIALKIERLKRAINSKFNTKYPNNYIDKVESAYAALKYSIDDEIRRSKKENKLHENVLIKPIPNNRNTNFSLPIGFSESERRYLESSISFFVGLDSISDVEAFFTNRVEILIGLAIYLKDTISGFDGSREREYLGELLKSFDSLRGGFNIRQTSNNVLRSIAVLFTSGRDLLRFIENNEREEIHNSLIYYSIWGSIYGAAILPKTLTDAVTDENYNMTTLLASFKSTVDEFSQSYLLSETIKDQIISNSGFEIINEIGQIQSTTFESNENKAMPLISVLGNRILEKVKFSKKVKISELKVLSKSFKRNADIEGYILNELSDFINITKIGSAVYAEIIDSYS